MNDQVSQPYKKDNFGRARILLNIAQSSKAKRETIWILRTEREQYFKMKTASSFVMCTESRGNVRGNECAVVIMVEGREQQGPK